jgi:hypothetical protein
MRLVLKPDKDKGGGEERKKWRVEGENGRTMDEWGSSTPAGNGHCHSFMVIADFSRTHLPAV